MAKFPKYIIKRSSNYQYYWVLFAVNGNAILNSETYVTKQGALDGIASSKKNIADSNFQRKTSSNWQYFFNQVANNSQVIGTSEMYNSSQAREDGISAVKRDAPIAEIEDLT
jgi:uncharacterized protein